MQIDTRPEDVGLSSPRLSRIGGWMRRWVDSGRLPGLVVAVVRDDRLAWIETCGRRDVEAGLPVVPDTVYRMYSMTKPITTVAALMLYEEGCFQLDDPIASYIPAFSETRVFAGGNADGFDTESLERPITVHDLMTHTSGLTYAFQDEHPVDALYRRHGIEFNANLGPLADLVEATAAQPLAFQPGTRWRYGVSTDVLGRLVEIWSGLSLDAFLAERIFTPLGMTDTGFHVPEGKRGRFASNYTRPEGGGLALVDSASESRFLEPAATLSGGGGLVSTAADYLRFTRMLRGRGTLGGTRVLGRKTVEHMTGNQLPGDLADMGQPRFSETAFTGVGFGLGVSVMLDPAKARIVGSPGEYAWGGVASTAFWVDPAEDLIVLLLTQLSPSSTYPIRRELRVLTYQALL
ncbi:MAG: serine hydrolase [Immundisolibacterales bacterium]|nr:serine hydrolase [Immundisolibacterales bacterium]